MTLDPLELRERAQFRPRDRVCCRVVMQSLLVAACSVFACYTLLAQNPAWQPSAGHTQEPIWPGIPPDAQPVTGPETSKTTQEDELVAGKARIYIENVSRPTLTVYSPAGNAPTRMDKFLPV
jgi:hypothetical protein